jgi:hypothetical protein
LEQAAVQALKVSGISVEFSIAHEWGLKHADKLRRLNLCAAADFVKVMLDD